MLRVQILLSALLSFVFSIAVAAQTNPNLETGLKPYGAYHGGNIDSISLANGNLTVQIPVVSYPQRGDLPYGYQLLYNSKGWSVKQFCHTGNLCDEKWIPPTTGGVQMVPLGGFGGSWKWLTIQGVTFPVFTMKTEDGGSHQMSGLPTGGLETVDGTGYYYNGSTSLVESDRISRGRNGDQYNEDRNGNMVSTTTDTVGRIPSSSGGASDATGCTGPLPVAFSAIGYLLAPNGGNLTYKVCTASVHLQSGFGALDEQGQPIAEGSADKDLTQSVVFYDGVSWATSLSWTFEYGDSYGDLTKITFPTGGTIKYIYSPVPNCGNALTSMSMNVMSRTVNANDGTGDHLTYWDGITIDPSGNETTHTIEGLGGTCSAYETQTHYYSGSHTSGTLLKSVTTEYSWTPNPFDLYGDGAQTAISVHPTRVTTVWADGTTSKVETDYDNRFTVTAAGQSYPGTYGNVIEQREYDFGAGASGPLLRKTHTDYQAFSNSAYSTANILSAVSQQVVSDGNGQPVSTVSYGYDEVGLVPSGVSIQRDANLATSIRGNRTSTTMLGPNGPIVSHATYYDTGMPYQVTDPGGHITTYTYSSAFAGSLPTQTCLPQTGGVVHCVNGDYDWNTGLLTTFADQNNQSNTYHYDVLSRFTEADFPNGGFTRFSYPDLWTAQRTKSVTSGITPTTTAHFDGFGRTIKMQNTDPLGDVFVDTAYDASGRVTTVSNPYRIGDTIYQTGTVYDALGRPCKLIPPDGSNSTPDCNPATASNIVFTAYSPNSATATDQAGKMRRSISDGLGRLVEIDEPTEIVNPGSPEIPPTGSTGTITVNGSLQSVPDPNSPPTPGRVTLTVGGSDQSVQVQIQPATAASGFFTITGGERKIRQTDCPIHQICYLYDAGRVTVNVGSYSFFAEYGQTSTATTVANAIRSQMSGNPTFVAGGTGAAITITTLTTGLAADYSISGSSYTYESSDFSGSSFGASPSGPKLTGGYDPVYGPLYDAGTVTLTINNNFSKSTSYSQTTQPSDIAAGLAAAFNGDGSSPVTAINSGIYLTLTSKAVGSSTNYPDSPTAASNDPGHFSSPSFSASGPSALSGGYDQELIYDSGSVSVNVGTASATANYSGSGTSPASIAASLATTLNASSSLNASASPGSNVINLSSKGTGVSTNYAVSFPASTFDTTHFSSPSFSTGGANMSGGADHIPAIPPYGTGVWSLATPAVTKYTYDALGNLTCVEQHGGVTGTGCAQDKSYDAASPWRVRRFTYDSLSRLTQASSPESGTINYAYNDDGVLLSKTDARGITITYNDPSWPSNKQVDGLHRVLQKTYSNGDPAVTYTYDSSTFGVGHRTSMTDASGSTNWTYDLMGREINEQRTIGTVTKSIGHSYNLDGSEATITYPSGEVITYSPDAAGRPASAADISLGVTYASAAAYTAAGSIASMNYGSGGIKAVNAFNSRLQPCRISVTTGTAPTSCTDSTNIGTLLDLGYDFGLGTVDNGNVMHVTNKRDDTRSQAFTYDGLNRLLTAQTSNSNNWANVYTYDAWGNLNKMLALGVKPEGQHFDQMSDITNRLVGYSYDAAGNMLTGVGGYDAEGRIASAGGVTYTYDGDGERVKKSGGTLYWGPGPLAESDLSGNITKEFVFFGGKRIARMDLGTSVHYYYSDQLGSANVVTNAAGTSIEEESDFYPFGGERSITSTGANAFKFTGKERDAETNNDYFGARYYNSSMGRWLSPDWSATPAPIPYADMSDPQSLNLYGYVRNRPTFAADPDGHCCDFSEANSLLDFGTGMLQGAASSLTLGLVGGAKATDSDASRAGQIAGATAVMVDGEANATAGTAAMLGGTALAPETGGTSLTVTAGGAALTTIGLTEAVGGSITLAKAIATPTATSGGYKPGGDFSKQTKQETADKAGNKCQTCGTDTAKAKKSEKGVTPPKNEGQTDHIQAKSQGGTNDPANAQHLCRNCNIKKSNK